MMLRDLGGFFFVVNPSVIVLLTIYLWQDIVYGTSASVKPVMTVDASVRENPASYRPVAVVPATPVARSTPSNPGAGSSSSGSRPMGGSSGGWSGGK